ncbi:hypothetical protein FMUND_14438 [Fusarium mundagurra]|uniref:Uncharacterized protein n=1 Tax=Fusarium mundagurra TaxID=1567541 RepID=A0A8H5XU52_9HYPO|nr:hypothetical protein FMUND_14438 [Fusarium mundagurra]
MAFPRGNSGQSSPPMSQDLQPSTAVGFQQQGTVDWTRIMSGSVTFSVDVLSRLSRAGVEAFTIYAARAIFSNVKIGPNGELRLHRALDTLTAFPSFGKVLWLGFGVKHIIWSMQESIEGLNCLGICACLTECYSTTVAAKIIRELFLLYDPPAELSPALRQWAALVEISGGLLASSEFGLVLHGLTKLCLMDGQRNLRSSGSPKDIALVLKEVFEVSAGRLDRLLLSGGADCAWIAAVAHWLLDLRVEVQDQDGTIIYRPDGMRSKSSLDSQVIITYHGGPSIELLRVSGKYYAIHSGRLLFQYSEHEDTMSCGRLPWESCLVDTFGDPMRMLLGFQARSTGACLGSAARIFLASVRDGEGHKEFSQTRDLEVRPTRSGLESLYWNQEHIAPGLLEPVVHGLLKSGPAGSSLMLAQMLFSGQQHERALGRDNIVATSRNGLCFYLNTLTEITSDPQRACAVTVVPGNIEWNHFMFNMVRDGISGTPGIGYDAVSMTTVTNFDDLADSSTPGLNAELIVEEVLPESNSLSAVYRISTAEFPSQHFLVKPSDIWPDSCQRGRAPSSKGRLADGASPYHAGIVWKGCFNLGSSVTEWSSDDRCLLD